MDANADTKTANVNAGKRAKEFSLEHYLSKQNLEEIRKLFCSSPQCSLKKSTFQSKVLNRYKVEVTDENLEVLYTKLDFDKSESISWEEFITYLILELECKEKEAYQPIIEPPIVGIPQVNDSFHRSPVIHVTFAPSVRINGTIDHDDGKYLTMSKDGQLNVWSCDLKLLRTYRDKAIYPTMKNTLVTNFVCLPDLNMIVTSSTELELRFYDMTCKRFYRILVIQGMPFCINHMYYHSTENVKDESLLICGDLGGNLRVLKFPTEDKGPFRIKIGVETMVMKWDQIVKGKLPLMKAYSITNVHLDWVKQVAYYKLLGSVVSCAASNAAMVVGDIYGSKNSYVFYLKRGIDTFCVCEDSPMIATGSMDCIIRLWNPFITTKPISLMRGHHASIVKIFFQNKGQRMFSLDRARVIRVWGIISQTCLQIYSGFTYEIGSALGLCAYYNERNHLFIVGGMKIGSVICGKLVDELRTDGNTHPGEVTVVLYNRLFKTVITCGSDSNIIIWDIRANKIKGFIRKAHSYNNMGVLVPLPITAATFDIPHNFLITGSTNGTIKIWDFNFGICLRNMELGKNREVTRLIWLKHRILAVGWNRRVVEFSDTLTGNVSGGKEWELRHNSDILAADSMTDQTLATGTYNGDIIMWKLETGQSFKRYNASYPTGILKLEYIKDKTEKKCPDAYSVLSKNLKTPKEKKEQSAGVAENISNKNAFSKQLKVPARNLLAEKVHSSVERNLAVHCLIFLKKREVLPDQATLLTATENGMIQAWSHHPGGSFLEAFKAVHTQTDYVMTMATDDDNEFLFTGTFCGYIKIWLMKNYCLSASVPPVHICMPQYRLQFPFLIRDSIITRAKAACKNQPKPLLLSSYKGHLGPIFSLTYIQGCKILLTGSFDKSARAWTLSGRYIGTLGQKKPWLHIEWGEDPEKTNSSADFRVPPDLVRTASYTTLKVLRGAPPIARKEEIKSDDLNFSEEEMKAGTFGKKLSPPYMGGHYEFPKKARIKSKVTPVDLTMMKIPVFVKLSMSEWQPILRPQTPKCVQDIKNQETVLTSADSRSDSSDSNK